MALTLVPTQAQGNGVEYSLVIACPSGPTNNCPIRAVDPDDMLGDPSLAVDPFDPDDLILASLHASGDEENAPGPKSRTGQAFTTFTSSDHGGEWTDSPFSPPPNFGVGAYGEHPQVAIDPYGFVYIGSLYAVDDGQDGFDYIIAAQNFTGIRQIKAAQNGAFSAKFIPSLVAKNEIKQFWYLYNPVEDVMNLVWWEAPGTNSQGSELSLDLPLQTGQPIFDRPEFIGADFLTETQQTANSGAIGLVWKDRRDYYGQKPADVIKPCDSGTNPVRSGQYIYVGCRVGEGVFKWDETVDVGTFVLFKFKPDLTELQYLGKTPLVGGEAKLGARSDGRLALASAGVQNDHLSLRIAYGHDRGNRIAWSGLDSFGNDLDVVESTEYLREANVQSMIYREDSGVLHLILKQYVGVAGTGLGAVAQIANPNIHKSLVAIDEKYGLLANLDLDVGNPLNRTDPILLTASEDAYNDLSDGFLQLPMAPYIYNGRDLGFYQREFFAVGDYGVVNFAEVIELTNLKCACPALPGSPPIPIPSPAASLTITQVMIPAAGITIAGLIAASFAINRTTSHNAAAAKGKK